MNRFLLSSILFSALCSFSTVVDSKELIKEFKGTGDKNTAEFEVEAPWIADWRVGGDYPGQMAVHVSLVSASSGEHLGKIVTTKYVTNGVRLFDEGGRYYFQINSSLANWTLRVEQLTSQEAETYTPKDKIE